MEEKKELGIVSGIDVVDRGQERGYDVTLYKDLTPEQKAMVDSEDLQDRDIAAEQGLGLDKLKDDYSLWVRARVAENGYALDELKDDEHGFVRVEVARQGYALDELKSDPDPEVRLAVADQGYALDELKNDEDWGVREQVAEQGYALDELKNDRNEYVRAAVARQGYALDELKNDESWIVRVAVASQGYALDELKDDEDRSVRTAVARQGYALDELKDDEHWIVREAVARQGYALDQLQYDLDPSVSIEVRHYLEDRNLTIEQWIEQNPDRCGLPENRPRYVYGRKVLSCSKSRWDDEWECVWKLETKNLPEGWFWAMYDDGSGSLRGPANEHLFRFDRQTHEVERLHGGYDWFDDFTEGLLDELEGQVVAQRPS